MAEFKDPRNQANWEAYKRRHPNTEVTASQWWNKYGRNMAAQPSTGIPNANPDAPRSFLMPQASGGDDISSIYEQLQKEKSGKTQDALGSVFGGAARTGDPDIDRLLDSLGEEAGPVPSAEVIARRTNAILGNMKRDGKFDPALVRGWYTRLWRAGYVSQAEYEDLKRRNLLGTPIAALIGGLQSALADSGIADLPVLDYLDRVGKSGSPKPGQVIVLPERETVPDAVLEDFALQDFQEKVGRGPTDDELERVRSSFRAAESRYFSGADRSTVAFEREGAQAELRAQGGEEVVLTPPPLPEKPSIEDVTDEAGPSQLEQDKWRMAVLGLSLIKALQGGI